MLYVLILNSLVYLTMKLAECQPLRVGANLGSFYRNPSDEALFVVMSFDNLFTNKKDYPHHAFHRRQSNDNIKDKRGFSMLTRLRLFSTLARADGFRPFWDRNRMISAETRAMIRPQGTPLRWG